VNLGWKLAAVVRGEAPPALLDSYEAERRPLALRNTGYARRFADSIGLFRAEPALDEESPRGEAARHAAAAYLDHHARLEFDIPGVTFGGRYDGSPVIVGDGSTPPPDEPNAYVPTACPGGRPPHAWLGDGSLYDRFHPTGWTLLALGPDPPATAAWQREAAALGLTLGVVRLAEPSLRELYAAPLALIRPDQVVAWRGAEGGSAGDVPRPGDRPRAARLARRRAGHGAGGGRRGAHVAAARRAARSCRCPCSSCPSCPVPDERGAPVCRSGAAPTCCPVRRPRCCRCVCSRRTARRPAPRPPPSRAPSCSCDPCASPE
jgi:hypothetical protein